MVRNDPFTPNTAEYECLTCGHRIASDDEHYATCPQCEGGMKNISVPRE